jgi:hypothetical protein
VSYIWKPCVWASTNVPLFHKLGVLIYFSEVRIRHILLLKGLRYVLLVHRLRWHLVGTLLMGLRIGKNSTCVLAGKSRRNVGLLIRVLFFLLIVTVSALTSWRVLRFFMSVSNFTSTLSGWIVVAWRRLFSLLVRGWVTSRGSFVRSELHADLVNCARHAVHIKHYFAQLWHCILKRGWLVSG